MSKEYDICVGTVVQNTYICVNNVEAKCKTFIHFYGYRTYRKI